MPSPFKLTSCLYLTLLAIPVHYNSKPHRIPSLLKHFNKFLFISSFKKSWWPGILDSVAIFLFFSSWRSRMFEMCFQIGMFVNLHLLFVLLQFCDHNNETYGNKIVETNSCKTFSHFRNKIKIKQKHTIPFQDNNIHQDIIGGIYEQMCFLYLDNLVTWRKSFPC